MPHTPKFTGNSDARSFLSAKILNSDPNIGSRISFFSALKKVLMTSDGLLLTLEGKQKGSASVHFPTSATHFSSILRRQRALSGALLPHRREAGGGKRSVSTIPRPLSALSAPITSKCCARCPAVFRSIFISGWLMVFHKGEGEGGGCVSGSKVQLALL